VQVPLGVMISNGPIFCLPKPCQPGQWRVLSDMHRGGHNEAIGPDPMVFPKSVVILKQLYTSGWSTVVDASNFFYQFTTYPPDRKYLARIHPRDSDKQYVYQALPMGAAASPLLAGCYRAAFLRWLRAASPLYQGTPICNTWRKSFSGESVYDPHLGYGCVLRSKHGGDGPIMMTFSFTVLQRPKVWPLSPPSLMLRWMLGCSVNPANSPSQHNLSSTPDSSLIPMRNLRC
jgi:hypothetical protein